MNFRENRTRTVAMLIGSILVAAHVALAAAAVVTLGQWVSGAAIGGVVLALVAVHLVVSHRRRTSTPR